jgi:hypothetical protein
VSDFPKVTVIPLQWKQMQDGAGVMRDIYSAWCPLFEKHYWAERADRMPKIDELRANRIMKVIQIEKDAKMGDKISIAEAQSAIEGVAVAEILMEAVGEFKGVYPDHVLSMGVGPMQSIIGLAILRGHLSLPTARIADLEALIPLVEYMAGQNEDHIRVALAGNPSVVESIISGAVAALAKVKGGAE